MTTIIEIEEPVLILAVIFLKNENKAFREASRFSVLIIHLLHALRITPSAKQSDKS